MIATALFLASLCELLAVICVLQEGTFLVPYRHLLFTKYGPTIVAFAGLLYVNLFAFFYLVIRFAFLKDMGHKLAHLEKELRHGGAVSEELARRLEE